MSRTLALCSTGFARTLCAECFMHRPWVAAFKFDNGTTFFSHTSKCEGHASLPHDYAANRRIATNWPKTRLKTRHTPRAFPPSKPPDCKKAAVKYNFVHIARLALRAGASRISRLRMSGNRAIFACGRRLTMRGAISGVTGGLNRQTPGGLPAGIEVPGNCCATIACSGGARGQTPRTAALSTATA